MWLPDECSICLTSRTANSGHENLTRPLPNSRLFLTFHPDGDLVCLVKPSENAKFDHRSLGLGSKRSGAGDPEPEPGRRIRTFEFNPTAIAFSPTMGAIWD